MEIIVVTAVVIFLECSMPISYIVDILCDVLLDACIDVLTGAIIGCVSGIGAEVLADANGNVFASLMTDLEFAVPTPLGEFCC